MIDVPNESAWKTIDRKYTMLRYTVVAVLVVSVVTVGSGGSSVAVKRD